MMKKTAVIAAATAWTLAAALGAIAEPIGQNHPPINPDRPTGHPITLALNLNKGVRYRYEHRMEQDSRQVVKDKSVSMQQDMVLGMDMEVLERLENGAAKVKLTYAYLKMTAGMPGRTFTYDTRSPDVVPKEAKTLVAMAGKSITITLQPNGEIVGVEGLTELIDEILKASVEDEQLRQANRRQIEQMFGETAMRERMRPLTQIYPDHTVDNGDSWENTFTITQGMPVIVHTQWTLLRHDTATARINVAADISSNKDAPPTRMGQVDIVYYLGGVQDGYLELDRTTGWIVAAELEQTMSGSITTASLQRGTERVQQRIQSRLMVVEVDEQGNPVR